MIVTAHAAQRYVERVNVRLTIDEARVAITAYERTIEAAAKFGCKVVRLGCKAKLILQEDRVVTVIPAEHPWSGHRLSLEAN